MRPSKAEDLRKDLSYFHIPHRFKVFLFQLTSHLLFYHLLSPVSAAHFIARMALAILAFGFPLSRPSRSKLTKTPSLNAAKTAITDLIQRSGKKYMNRLYHKTILLDIHSILTHFNL